MGAGAGTAGPTSGPGLGIGPGRQAEPKRTIVAVMKRSATRDMSRKVVKAENLRQSGIEKAEISVGFSGGLLSSVVCGNFAVAPLPTVVRAGPISWRGRIRWPVVPTAVARATLIHITTSAPIAVGG